MPRDNGYSDIDVLQMRWWCHSVVVMYTSWTTYLSSLYYAYRRLWTILFECYVGCIFQPLTMDILYWSVATTLYGPAHLVNYPLYCLDVTIHSILSPFPPPQIDERGLNISWWTCINSTFPSTFPFNTQHLLLTIYNLRQRSQLYIQLFQLCIPKLWFITIYRHMRHPLPWNELELEEFYCLMLATYFEK